VGRACIEFHNKMVRGIESRRVQCDEIWSFVYAKQKNVPDEMNDEEGKGDVWTWVGIDADSKLVISWLVGNRDAESANDFMQDIADRFTNRVQLNTDGFKPYLEAVTNAFGSQIDFAQLVKIYGGTEGNSNERKYSPAECTGAKKIRIECYPRQETRFNLLCRTSELNHAYAHEKVYKVDQCLLIESGKPRLCHCITLCLL
jgi:hypothetical protein